MDSDSDLEFDVKRFSSLSLKDKTPVSRSTATRRELGDRKYGSSLELLGKLQQIRNPPSGDPLYHNSANKRGTPKAETMFSLEGVRDFKTEEHGLARLGATHRSMGNRHRSYDRSAHMTRRDASEGNIASNGQTRTGSGGQRGGSRGGIRDGNRRSGSVDRRGGLFDGRRGSNTLRGRDGIKRGTRGGGSVGNLGGGQQRKPRMAIMGYRRLQELILSDMDDRTLCLTLISETSGFSQLLEHEHIKPDWMKFLLELISRACKSSVTEYVIPLLNKVAQSRFLEQHVSVGYVLRMPHERSPLVQQGFVQTIEHILDILEAILTRLPSFCDKCEAVLIILETIPQRLEHVSGEETSLLEFKTAALKERANDVHARGARETRRSDGREPPHQRAPENFFENVPPPDDFRQMSICPTYQDIHTETRAYVRPNKDQGGYDDVNHYLDVQFRLLREDYVRPLREGIAEYLQNVKADKPNAKLSDMRLYHEVQIICPMCTPDGIVYRIQFANKQLRNIRWQASKRLIYGSLLCLSSDNFQTLLFATVNGRDNKNLAEGFVDIRFVEHFDLQERGQETFVMAETTAYFEAYRHVLAGLQEITDEVPFQRYIVSCLSDVRPPQYLRRDIPRPYDLSFCVKAEASREQKMNAKSVPVLTTSRWPTTDSLCFDDSQLKAVKTALTKEFAIIQGPPGTGKTYVGLKIVKALLVNKAAWGAEKPILVVCYTNHALDQFLEGMLEFGVEGLLRVGGRSNNEKLAKFTIKSKKDELRRKKERRRDILDGNRDCRAAMNALQNQIEDTSVKLEMSARGILHENALQCFMIEEQFDSFSIHMHNTSGRKETAMPLWLDIAVDMYGELEGFGQSRMFALTPEHIAGLVFRLKVHDKGHLNNVSFLEMSQQDLESRLIQEDRMDVHDQLAARWNQYHHYHGRFYTKQVFGLKNIQKDIFHLEGKINSSNRPSKSKHKRGQKPGNDVFQEELIILRRAEAEMKENMVMLQNMRGILRASVLAQVMDVHEKRNFGLHLEVIDDFLFARWLGYGDVVDCLIDEMTDVDVDDDEFDETDELIDVEEEAELLTKQRLVEDDDEEAKTFAQAREEKREHAKRMALKDLSVNLDRVSAVASQDGWQTKMPSKKKQKQRVKQIIQSVDKMSAEEAAVVSNVWQLNSHDRSRLYAYWLALYRDNLKTSIQTLNEEYEGLARRLKQIREDEDYHIMNDATVIGMTTTGAAKFRHVMQRIKAPIIVVEEAAEVLESHIISALNPSCEHLILIGDHKQLRPSPAVYELAKHFNLELSLFERMVNNDVRCDTLELQHRMRPEIAELMKFIYPKLKNHDSVIDLDPVKGVSCNLFFIDHQFPEVKHEENRSRSNSHEALFLAAFCRYLLLQGYEPSQITVLTGYSGQVFELKKAMPRKSFEGVRITAVDNYQGEENDIILLSLVRSNPEGSIGFLNVDNRVCVALSRARKGLYVIGNFALLSRKSPLWTNMVNMMKGSDLCGKELELYCQNHPRLERIRASTDKDFAGAPEGGCMRPCESRLTCGHQCQKPCHNLDRNHEKYPCQKPCARECKSGHRCKKLCYKDCGDCRERVEKIIPKCGHQQLVPCHQDPFSFICQANCAFSLPCGHMCAEKCGSSHTKMCKTEIRRTWPCGHVVKTACHHQPENFPCPEPCKAVLECGHPCTGSCSTCLQGRLHQGCTNKCGRTLVCGHDCRQACTKSCPPCMSPCENRCIHSRCEKTCGEACISCHEPCKWSCKHAKCTKLCGEICNRPPCNKPCRKRLPCGHPCIGLCGEECPQLCRICDKDKVCELFFGTEDEDDARFILLEDCNDVVEVSGMDHWMSISPSNESGKTDVQLKVCPKCKVTIRKSLRYGNFVKKQLRDIEEVKLKIRGSKRVIDHEIARLKGKLKKADLSDQLTHNAIEGRLSKPDLSLLKLSVLGNQIELLKHGHHLIRQLAEEKTKGEIEADHENEMLASVRKVHKQILEWRNFVSEQQLQEAKFELLRLSYLFKIRICQQKLKKKFDVPPKVTLAVQKAMDKLESNRQFDSNTEQEMSKLEKILKKFVPMGISESERKMVVQAIGLSQGHWFKCPNGHFYAIGDCGGAMEESTCPECRAKIGGTQHKLLHGNQLAPEMDGAKYAAWSDQANMGNYDFDDLVPQHLDMSDDENFDII